MTCTPERNLETVKKLQEDPEFREVWDHNLDAAESDQILGFAALGPETGEWLTAVQVFSNVSTPVAL